MGEFDGETEFAAGDVRGTRAFRVDAEGRLRGVVYEVKWRPGENVAVCYRGVPPAVLYSGASGSMASARAVAQARAKYGSSWTSTAASGSGGGGGGWTTFSSLGSASAAAAGLHTPPPAAQTCSCGCNQPLSQVWSGFPPPSQDPRSPCEGLDVKCGCGFYAYQRGSNDYYTPGITDAGYGEVGAIVRGYGKVVLGTKGFRAEKAEILAVYVHRATSLRAAGREGGNEVTNGLIRYRIERLYKVPLFDDYYEMLRAFPIDEPEPGDEFWAS